MRITVQIIIALILVWLHTRSLSDTVIVSTPTYSGITPITQQSLPLTADDVARGLRANTDIDVPTEKLTNAHRLRTEYATKMAERTELIDTLGTQGLLLLEKLEEQ